MEVLTDVLMEAIFTILGMIIAIGVSYFAHKLKYLLDKVIEKDDLGIIESLVEKSVEFVEEEFQGEEGEIKFDKAVERASLLISNYGIGASDELIRSSIQEGWRKVNDKQTKEGDE